MYRNKEVMMNIIFVASVSVISADMENAKQLFVDDLGLRLEDSMHDGYWHSEKIAGTKHFGVWPLRQAAQACFGVDVWPSDRPVPQASVEFEATDAASVAQAVVELQEKGHTLIHDARTEPWGQTVARMQTSDGMAAFWISCPSWPLW
jgi:hypothetical protein